MTKKRFISLDFDGCIYNRNIDDVRAFDEDKKPTEDLNLEHLGSINERLIEYINRKKKEFSSSTIFLGSDRQDYKKEMHNSSGPRRESQYCYPFIVDFSKSFLDSSFDNFLMADIYNDLPPGQAFKQASLNYYNLEAHRKDPETHPDQSKITLLYAQMHKAASENPGDEITYEFYDDRKDILSGLKFFFESNPETIPSNLNLSLNHYDGGDVENILSIQGQGKTNASYKETLKTASNVSKSADKEIHDTLDATTKSFLKIKQTLQNFNTSQSKKSSFGNCQTLRDLCFASSIRQKSGIFHPKNTTTTGNELVRLLNLPKNDLIRREICPNGAEVRMRDIRNYALHGVKSESGYFLSDKDKDNEKVFAHSKNKNKEQPMLIFQNYLEKHSDSDRSNSVSSDLQS